MKKNDVIVIIVTILMLAAVYVLPRGWAILAVIMEAAILYLIWQHENKTLKKKKV